MLHKRIHSSMDHHNQQSFVATSPRVNTKRSNYKGESRVGKKLLQLNNGNSFAYCVVMNKRQDHMDFETMRKILTKLGTTSYTHLKYDLLTCKKMWRDLKNNPQDNVICLDKLKNYINYL